MNKDHTTTQGKQFFNVPNDEEGCRFIDSARKYLNKNPIKGKKLVLMGRGPRPSSAYQSWIPKSKAAWFAVYIDLNEEARRLHYEEQRRRQADDLARHHFKADSENDRLKAENDSLKAEVDNLKLELGKLVIEQANQVTSDKVQTLGVPVAVAAQGKQIVIRIAIE